MWLWNNILYIKSIIIYMLKPLLLEKDDDIDYLRYWRKTLAYKYLRIKEPSESWKLQLRRILFRNNN